jgi:hypothetical protein
MLEFYYSRYFIILNLLINLSKYSSAKLLKDCKNKLDSSYLSMLNIMLCVFSLWLSKIKFRN